MTLLDTCPKQQCKVSKSEYFVVKLIELEILCLRMRVLTIWILFQRLGVTDKTALLDLSWKIKLLLLSSTLNPDWRIYLVKRRYIYMLEIQYSEQY